METIFVTVSVLSTVGVVAIVLYIVNVLNGLKGKVDVQAFDNGSDNMERSLSEDIEKNYRLIHRNVEDIHNIYDRKIEVLEDIISKVDKRIDSRSDKLVDHMCKEFNAVHEKLDNKKDSNLKLLKD